MFTFFKISADLTAERLEARTEGGRLYNYV